MYQKKRVYKCIILTLIKLLFDKSKNNKQLRL